MTLANGHGTLMQLRCSRCSARFLHRVTKGADPKYCGAACRRAEASERRRIKRETEKAEEYRRTHRPRIDL